MTTILLIEDDQDLRRATLEVLKYGGYVTLEAADGVEGLDVARQHTPDLILCDINMPHMNGYELVEELQDYAETATIPVIFLTALSQSDAMRRGMTAGADDYLIKPVIPDELFMAIETRLKKRDRLDEKHDTELKTLRKNIIYALPHEMRTPLHLIMGFASMLELNHSAATPEEILTSAQAIEKASHRLERLIENYLVYAQIEVIAGDEAEQAALRNHTLSNAREVIIEAINDKASAFGRVDDICARIDPVTLNISWDNLSKLVGELVDNALKFSEPSTPVEINGAASGEQYVLTVRDHGRGMDAAEIKQIGAYMQFERNVYEQQGLGLGLVITKRLVELHGGQFAIYSAKEAGSTVTLTLPM